MGLLSASVDADRPTEPQHVWALLAPDQFHEVPRHVTHVAGLRVEVWEYEISPIRWEIGGHCDGLRCFSLGRAADLAQAKADGIRAAYRLAAKGWLA